MNHRMSIRKLSNRIYNYQKVINMFENLINSTLFQHVNQILLPLEASAKRWQAARMREDAHPYQFGE